MKKIKLEIYNSDGSKKSSIIANNNKQNKTIIKNRINATKEDQSYRVNDLSLINSLD